MVLGCLCGLAGAGVSMGQVSLGHPDGTAGSRMIESQGDSRVHCAGAILLWCGCIRHSLWVPTFTAWSLPW